ncbi:MAG TPA: gamma-glutamyltransferase [Thermoanaerobaculia bacterium]|nr:gamma-glutamyltransferase [Thermoanaerobaculia bacterium]
MIRRTGIAILHLLLPLTLMAGSQSVAKKAALSTASPQATQVGLSVLRRGGNAIDAAVAVSFALAVTHPRAGNLGGGGFLIYYEAKSKAVWALDYREVAPIAAKRDMYKQKDGTASAACHTGPLAAAVPTSVAGLEEMHRRFGSRGWAELIAPAIRLARGGIKTDAELATALADAKRLRKIDQFAATSALFYPSGSPATPGSTVVQNDLAETLSRIAEKGAKDFYDGEIAKHIVESVRAAGGYLGFRDLREYKPVWRAPLEIVWRGYHIYAMPPPSTGGVALGEILNILGTYDLKAAGFQTARSLHLMAEAERRAYLDRNKYIGDPTTTRIPYAELLSEDRARLWRASIDLTRATPSIALTEPNSNPEGNHTTHFTIADAEGNVAAVTTTLDDAFGSGFVVPGCGFFLNNAMSDFSATPGKPDQNGVVQSPVNAIEPGKRPASSMTPVIILESGKPFMALGTEGGAMIPTTILQVFLNVVVYGKTLYEAVAAPRYHHQGYPEEIFVEHGKPPRSLVDQLNAMGHGTRESEAIGDVHAILFEKGKMTAVADPRHGGAAGGL